MATAAAALSLLRRQAAAPASLFPRPYSKAAAAVLPTVSRAHVDPPLLRPSLLRFYSSKGADATATDDILGTPRMKQGTDGTTTDNNFLGTQLFNPLMAAGHLKFLVADLGVQTKRVLEAVRTCKKAVYMMHDDPDKGFAMWEEGSDDLTRSVAVYKNTIDGIAKATASIKGSRVDVVLEEGVLSDAMDDYDRTMREVCAEVEDFLSSSRGDMKKLSRGDEEPKTIRMINKGLVALTLGGLSLLLLLAPIGM